MDWFANEDFWRDLYPFMFPPERFSEADEQVAQILTLTQFQGRRVLDLCCGPGRHALAFATRGFDVTGVDRSDFLLEKARAHASDSSASVEWVPDDMRSFRSPESYDLVCNLHSSFGYFEQEDEDVSVLRNVYDTLRPGGVFVLDVMGKERLARVWYGVLCIEHPDGSLFIQRARVRDDWYRIRNEWILIRDSGVRRFHFDTAIYSGRELKDRLLLAGFKQVQLFGSLGGIPYGLDAPRLVAVAHKQ